MTGLAHFGRIVGCDPGPVYCAFAAVDTTPGGDVSFAGCDYVPVAAILSGKCLFRREPAKPAGYLGMTWRQVDDGLRNYAFAYEKMSARYGAFPGATTYDTCRNSGVVLADAVRNRHCSVAYALGTADWRVALGGHANLSDAEVHQLLIDALGEDADAELASASRALKKLLGLKDPCSCHMRDALACALGLALYSGRTGQGTDKFIVYKREN